MVYVVDLDDTLVLTKNLNNDAYNFALEKNGKSRIKTNSVFDENFPSVNVKLKNSEKPFFFVYKGDITLLPNTDKNITVIGVLTPSNEIVEREQKVVKSLTEKCYNIVSGLAKGCDRGHQTKPKSKRIFKKNR